MRKDIHPEYYVGEIVCGTCGTVWNIGSTRQNLRLNICSNCHPFYTGEQRMLVDTEGQVDRFMKKLAATQEKKADARRRRESQKKQEPAKKSLLQEIYGDEADSATAATPADTPDMADTTS